MPLLALLGTNYSEKFLALEIFLSTLFGQSWKRGDAKSITQDFIFIYKLHAENARKLMQILLFKIILSFKSNFERVSYLIWNF